MVGCGHHRQERHDACSAVPLRVRVLQPSAAVRMEGSSRAAWRPPSADFLHLAMVFRYAGL